MTSTPGAGWYADPSGSGLRWWDGFAWTQHTHAIAPAASSPTQPRRPEPRLIRTPSDAEQAAAEWMRYWGFADAQRTPDGPDGGIDVVATGAIAQVKDYGTPVGRPVLQQLVGAALGRRSLCFARQAFTAEATAWAEKSGVALFRFDLQGEPQAENDAARYIVSAAAATPTVGPPGLKPAPTQWALPLTLSDSAARHLVRVGRQRGRAGDTVVWVRQAWLPLHVVTLTAVSPATGRSPARSTTTTIYVDSWTGVRWTPTKRRDVSLCQLPAGTTALDSIVRGEQYTAHIAELYRNLGRLSQAAARQRAATRLTALHLPVGATDPHLRVSGVVLLPVFFGQLDSPQGSRLIAIDGANEEAVPTLSELAVRHFDWVTRELDRVGARLCPDRSDF